MVSHGRSRQHEPWLLGPPWVSDAVAYLLMGLVTLCVAPLLAMAALPLLTALAVASLWLLIKKLADMLSGACDSAVVAYRGWHSGSLSGPWFRSAMCVFPPVLAEGFLNDLCHRREQMAREGYRQMTIGLATALVYGQAFVGWLFIIVLRVLTIPSQKPKD